MKRTMRLVSALALAACLASFPAHAAKETSPEDEDLLNQTPFRIHMIREVQRRRELDRLHDLGPAFDPLYRRAGDPEPVIDAALDGG